MEDNRILDKDLFLFLLDIEVKRARRYQNFLALLLLKVKPLLEKDSEKRLEESYKRLSNVVLQEIRESDLLGSLEKNRLVVMLPYADEAAGNYAKSRLTRVLEDCDFQNEGYNIMIHQTCFPLNGTNTEEIIRNIYM